MIQGLQVTVETEELRGLCLARAAHHDQRAEVYEVQFKNLEAAEVEGMNYTGGDPKRQLKEKRDEHANEAEALQFIAAHLKSGEEYQLGRDDLVRLGIQSSGW